MPSQVSTNDIEDGAVIDSKVGASAAIQTTKLADGAEFVKRDGSVPFTGDVQMGGKKATNAADGAAGTDLTTKQQMDAAISSATSSLVDSAKLHFFQPMTQPVPGDLTQWQFQQDPTAGKYMIFKDGIVVFEGATEDYTRNGSVITFNAGREPSSNQKVSATYLQT